MRTMTLSDRDAIASSARNVRRMTLGLAVAWPAILLIPLSIMSLAMLLNPVSPNSNLIIPGAAFLLFGLLPAVIFSRIDLGGYQSKASLDLRDGILEEVTDPAQFMRMFPG